MPDVGRDGVLRAGADSGATARRRHSGSQLTSSIMDILRRINVERRLTLVVSQHQLETALAYATRIVGFRRGRVGFDGPPSALSPAVIAAIYGDGDAA